jgi:hypothetical protein
MIHFHDDEYMIDVTLMIEKEQDALNIELTKGQHNESRGYNIRIGN